MKAEESQAASPWSVAIVIPAQNEKARIERCVNSVIAAIEASVAARAWVVVVADDCTDGTQRIATHALGEHGVVIKCTARSPGTARRLGVDAAFSHFANISASRLWVANTDADSFVPADWIQRQLRLADESASAVAGIVAVDSFEEHGTNGAAWFESNYTLYADGTHQHVHGANIGMRADVYLDAGGWTDAVVGEDHCLWRRVKARGWPVRASSASVVTTSGRLTGRASGGFADTLRAGLTNCCPALSLDAGPP